MDGVKKPIKLQMPRQSRIGKYNQQNKVLHAEGDSWAF